MNINNDQKEAMRTLNPELNKKDILINSVMGYNLGKDHLIKESGDIAWYLAKAATALDVPLDTILQRNLDKLHKRYPDGFSINAFINRQK